MDQKENLEIMNPINYRCITTGMHAFNDKFQWKAKKGLGRGMSCDYTTNTNQNKARFAQNIHRRMFDASSKLLPWEMVQLRVPGIASNIRSRQ